MQSLPIDKAFFQSLRKFDYDLFIAAKTKGCPHCGGTLDVANFPRKPRGLAEREELRFSLCCRNESCRKRLTPPSLLYYPRKVYPALAFILAVDFCAQLGLTREIARQTIARWRKFWKARLSEMGSFMRWARGFLPPGWKGGETPSHFLSLFGFPELDSLVPILRFFTQQT